MPNFKEANLYFSAERTMLSWQRSALSFVALGFGLERYAFMKNAALPNQINHIHYLISECVGLSLILVGTFIAFKSAAHFKSFLSSLSLDDLPTIKIHCSLLAVDALTEAIYGYFQKTGKPISPEFAQKHNRIITCQTRLKH